MFAMDDELYSSYQTLKRTFGGNEIVLIVYHDGDLMNREGQGRQRRICAAINQVEGIQGNAISLESLISAIESFNVGQFQAILKFTGLNISTEQLIRKTKALFQGFTHSPDGQTAAIVVFLKAKEETHIRRGEIVNKIRNELTRLRRKEQFENEIQLVGEPVMVADGFRMVQADGQRLGAVATIALSLVVLLAFQSLRWTLVPAAIVQFSLLTSHAIVALMDLRVTIVGSMSTAIITVIAVSTIIHFIIRIRKNINEGMGQAQATERAFHQLAIPITFACLTDAIGFGSLWFAELEPVQDFATVMVTGSLLVLIAFWMIVPALAQFRFANGLPLWDLKPGQTRLHRAFGQGLKLPLQLTRQYPKTILGITLGIFLFSLMGIQKNRIESDFTKNFRPHSTIVKSYRFVEDNLGGAGVWDVMVQAPQKINLPFLKKIDAIQKRLRLEVTINRGQGQPPQPGLTKVISLVDAIQSFSGQPVDQLSAVHVTTAIALLNARMPQLKNSLVSTDPHEPSKNYYRIMLRSRERTASEEKKSVISQVNAICASEFKNANGDPPPTIRTTGFYVLLAYMIESVLRDQWKTFGIAALGILAMLVLVFRDLRLAAIGLLPNLLPVLLIMGLFGWFDVPLNLGIALIAAVAIGLSIDSSIHYIFDFQQKQKTMGVESALDSVQGHVGSALIYSTFALMIGFLSLCFSDFLPTVYFGATAMIAMAGGLIGNLFLLPLLIARMTDSPNPAN